LAVTREFPFCYMSNPRRNRMRKVLDPPGSTARAPEHNRIRSNAEPDCALALYWMVALRYAAIAEPEIRFHFINMGQANATLIGTPCGVPLRLDRFGKNSIVSQLEA
jgi:beta-lactamase superfamily II metal-dependent hydrolase